MKSVERALREACGIRSIAAKALGCSPSAITHFAKRHPEIADIEQEIQDEILDLAESHLFNNIKAGDPHAIRYYLNQRGKDRGYGKKVMVAGDPENPINPEPKTRENLAKLSVEELRELHRLKSKMQGPDGATG